jgi:hypothetical protein
VNLEDILDLEEMELIPYRPSRNKTKYETLVQMGVKNILSITLHNAFQIIIAEQ